MVSTLLICPLSVVRTVRVSPVMQLLLKCLTVVLSCCLFLSVCGLHDVAVFPCNKSLGMSCGASPARHRLSVGSSRSMFTSLHPSPSLCLHLPQSFLLPSHHRGNGFSFPTSKKFCSPFFCFCS